MVKPTSVFHRDRLFDAKGGVLPLHLPLTSPSSQTGSISASSSALQTTRSDGDEEEKEEGNTSYRLTTASQMITIDNNSNDSLFMNRGKWGYGGDFGERSGKADAQFCANGLVFADRVGFSSFSFFHFHTRFAFENRRVNSLLA